MRPPFLSLEPVPAMAHHLGMGTVADLDNLAFDQMTASGLDALLLSVHLLDGELVVESQTDDDARVSVTASSGSRPSFTTERPLSRVWEMCEAGLTIDRIEPASKGAVATYGTAQSQRPGHHAPGQRDTYQAGIIDTRRSALALLTPAVFGALFDARFAGNGDVRRVRRYGKQMRMRDGKDGVGGWGSDRAVVAESTYLYLEGQENDHDDDGWLPLWWYVSKFSSSSPMNCTITASAGLLAGAGDEPRIDRIRTRASNALGVDLCGVVKANLPGSTRMTAPFVDKMGDSLPGDGRVRSRGELAAVLTAEERAALKAHGAVPERPPEDGIPAGGIEWRDPTGNEAAARVDKMTEWRAAGLTERQAYTLMASRLGWKQREIAARVGISRDAVGTAIRSAKKKLEKVGQDVHKMSS